jgi:hypothetical protein
LENLVKYLQLGFTHVIPFGFDHILFILCLFFYNPKLKVVLLYCTVFTFAHSLALALSVFGYFIYNSNIIEPLIALTIFYSAIENVFFTNSSLIRIVIISIFGVIHGLGFATALSEIGIPKNQFLSSLLSFNFGVELGQIAIILLAYFLISKWFSHKTWYKERVVYPISTIIACISIYWVIERLLYFRQ